MGEGRTVALGPADGEGTMLGLGFGGATDPDAHSRPSTTVTTAAPASTKANARGL